MSDSRSPASQKIYAAKKFLAMVSQSGSSKDVHHSEGAYPPGWNPDPIVDKNSPETTSGSEGASKSSNIEKGAKGTATTFIEEADNNNNNKENKENKEKDIRSITLPVDVDRQRFHLYQSILSRIITKSGTYSESTGTFKMPMLRFRYCVLY